MFLLAGLPGSVQACFMLAIVTLSPPCPTTCIFSFPPPPISVISLSYHILSTFPPLSLSFFPPRLHKLLGTYFLLLSLLPLFLSLHFHPFSSKSIRKWGTKTNETPQRENYADFYLYIIDELRIRCLK